MFAPIRLPLRRAFLYNRYVMRALTAATAAALLILLLVPGAHAQTTEADLYVAQAILDFDDRKYDSALDNLRKALALEPDHLEALYYMGVVHMAQARSADAIPFLERARMKAPDDPAVALQLGLAYFALQQYDRAQPLLEEAFRRQPDQDGLGYYVGFMRYRNKDYRGALQAFRTGRSTDPEIQQLTRLYTGLALAVQGLSGQAANEVEEALRLAPATALTGPVERLRDTIVAARQRERRLSAEIRFGFFYDNNVAVVPDKDTGEHQDPLVAVLREANHVSTGELFGLRADYIWWKTDAWAASIGYSFFGTYNNALPSFNVTNHVGTLGLTYRTALGGMAAQAGAQYSFDILFLDEDEFIRRHTGTIFGTLVESDLHLTQVFGRYQRKEFNQLVPQLPQEEDRTGNNWTVGFTHFLRFAQDRHFIKGGYQFDYEDTVGRNYEYRGHRIVAGGQYTLPWYGIRLKYDLDVHLRGYVFKNTLLPTNDPGTKTRYDKELVNVVRIEIPIPYKGICLPLEGPDRRDCLTLSAEWQHTNNISNIAVFDYTRDVTSLTLSWTY